MTARYTLAGATCAMLLHCNAVYADAAPTAPGLLDALDTTVSLRSAIWSGTRRLDDQDATGVASAWGRARFKFDSLGSVLADGYLAGSNDSAARRVRVRELYWQYQVDALRIRAGRQMSIWGRADGINPTDNLTPHDYTLLTPEDGDQRRGRDAVQVGLDQPFGQLVAWWSPAGSSNTVPLPALPGVRYLAPEAERMRQWALKWDHNHDGIDGSLSYYHGSDLMPDMVIAGISAGALIVAQRNHPSRVFGIDFSLSSKRVVWRAEAAYSRTDSAGPDDFNHKKPQLRAVAGPEFSVGESTTFGIQAIWQQVRHFSRPDRIKEPVLRELAWQQAALSNQTSASQAGVTWRLANRWRNDTVLAETSGALITTDGSGVWRTKLHYALDDHWSVQAGSDVYFGNAHSFYGKLAMNRLLFVQLRYGL